MNKIGSLRDALAAALKELRDSPDRLSIYVDRGRIVSRRTPALGWEYRYRVRIWLPNFAGNADRVMVPLLLWLRVNQPDLLLSFENDDGKIAFVADILSETETDILIDFDLSEAVQVTARPDDSGWDVVHLPEPNPDDLLLESATIDTPLEQLWLGGDRLIPLPE